MSAGRAGNDKGSPASTLGRPSCIAIGPRVRKWASSRPLTQINSVVAVVVYWEQTARTSSPPFPGLCERSRGLSLGPPLPLSPAKSRSDASGLFFAAGEDMPQAYRSQMSHRERRANDVLRRSLSWMLRVPGVPSSASQLRHRRCLVKRLPLLRSAPALRSIQHAVATLQQHLLRLRQCELTHGHRRYGSDMGTEAIAGSLNAKGPGLLLHYENYCLFPVTSSHFSPRSFLISSTFFQASSFI